jgi:NAD dependent epimerase/dehydratase family enzyme
MLGEMSRVVLNSNRTSADKILKAGFSFKFPKLENALSDIYA